jgi:hypothetical protein
MTSLTAKEIELEKAKEELQAKQSKITELRPIIHTLGDLANDVACISVQLLLFTNVWGMVSAYNVTEYESNFLEDKG